jgi:hypothetical protein
MPGANRNVSKSKYWCFTLNNFTPSEVLTLRRAGRNSELVHYLVFGREVGDSGTRHLQGYIEFRIRKSLPFLKRTISQRAHWETRKGKGSEASLYCRKDGDYEEFGESPGCTMGKRTDLDKIRERIKDGATSQEIADSYFSQWCIYRKAFAEYRSLCNPPRDRLGLRVYVLWGEPGTGKTRFVHYVTQSAGVGLWTSCTPDLKWFDGYRGEPVVLLDDYRGEGSGSFLLRVLDIYALQVPVKGGFVAWIPTTIFMTSNMNPREWHPEVWDALKRRTHDRIQFLGALRFPSSDLDDLKNKLYLGS